MAQLRTKKAKAPWGSAEAEMASAPYHLAILCDLAKTILACSARCVESAIAFVCVGRAPGIVFDTAAAHLNRVPIENCTNNHCTELVKKTCESRMPATTQLRHGSIALAPVDTRPAQLFCQPRRGGSDNTVAEQFLTRFLVSKCWSPIAFSGT